jgi:Ca2+-binding RTX toxin-like protein
VANVSVTVKDTVLDVAGNKLVSVTDTDVPVDTRNPIVENPIFITTNRGAVPSINSGESTKDKTVELSGKAEDASGFGGVEIYKLGANNTSIKVGETSVGAGGYWSYTTDSLVDGNYSYTAKAIDLNGNETFYQSTSFSVNTRTTTTDVDGVVFEEQLAKNGLTSGNLISPFNQTVDVNKIDLSSISKDTTVDNTYGSVIAGSGANSLSAKIPNLLASNGSVFNAITTGSGNDRIFGNEGLSEVLFAGSGYNQIDGGNSANTVDYVDYRSLTANNAVNKTSSSVTVAGTAVAKSITINPAEIRLGDFYSVTVAGRTVGITATQEMISNPALLVSALAAQLTTFVAANSINGLNASASGNSLTLNASSTNADVLALVASSAPVSVTSQLGVTVDLSQLVNTDPTVNYETKAYMAVHNNGAKDELVNIEGVLGTGYTDVIIGGDALRPGETLSQLDNVFLGGGGDDIISGGAGNDVLIGGQGNDVIYGGTGTDRIIGGEGRDVIYGGTGRDTIVIGLDTSGTSDTIRDFEVSAVLTGLAGRSAQAMDKIDFNFSTADLAAKLGKSIGELPSTLNYKVVLDDYLGSITPAQASATTPYSRVLSLLVEVTANNWMKVSEVRMDWQSNPFGSLDPNAYILSAIEVPDPASALADPALLGSFDPTSGDNHQLFASLQFQRVGEIIDTTASEAIVGARSGDIFVMSGGDDVVVGGLGSDRYEARIQGTTSINAINNGVATINELGRSSGGLEEDSVLIEGVRDLSDLNFSRKTIAGEQTDRSLAIQYEQFRGQDDPTTTQNEASRLHATGQIDIFNQFSLTQSGLYSVEKLQIAAEMENPLSAAVQTYYLGDVQGRVSGTNGGDIIHADADRNSLLIGNSALDDKFLIEAPTADSNYLDGLNADGSERRVVAEQDVWLYGANDGDDSVVIKVGSGSVLSSTAPTSARATIEDSDAVTSGTQLFEKTMADGSEVKYAKVTFNVGGTATKADDVTLNIFFADAGNVDSTTLLNRIKWES